MGRGNSAALDALFDPLTTLFWVNYYKLLKICNILHNLPKNFAYAINRVKMSAFQIFHEDQFDMCFTISLDKKKVYLI